MTAETNISQLPQRAEAQRCEMEKVQRDNYPLGDSERWREDVQDSSKERLWKGTTVILLQGRNWVRRETQRPSCHEQQGKRAKLHWVPRVGARAVPAQGPPASSHPIPCYRNQGTPAHPLAPIRIRTSLLIPTSAGKANHALCRLQEMTGSWRLGQENAPSRSNFGGELVDRWG